MNALEKRRTSDIPVFGYSGMAVLARMIDLLERIRYELCTILTPLCHTAIKNPTY